LTKPCDPETFTKALNAGIDQHSLITAEKQILSQTLNSSLQVMVEILSMVNPTAFSRANRVKRMACDIAAKLKVTKIWEVEIAAMLSQVGCITVPEETLQKIAKAEPLLEHELQLYSQHPKVAHDLIERIPRMKAVAQIIRNQNRRMNDVFESNNGNSETSDVKSGSQILKVVLDFDKMLETGNLPHQAFMEMSERVGWYDQSVLVVLKEIIDRASEEFIEIEIDVRKLQPGMLLNKPVYSNRKALLLSAGQDITQTLIMRLISFAVSGMMPNTVHVSVPLDRFQVEDFCGDDLKLPPPHEAVQADAHAVL
jgi:hypothetical protein